MLDKSYFTNVRGAVYYPSRAYNAWQTWNEYDPAEIDRDFGYAQDTGINALRMFVSYEFWLENPVLFFDRFENLVEIAVAHGIRIMPVLFEDCGSDNTPETRADKNPHTAICVCSPCRAIQKNPERWVEVHSFVDAFMSRYGSDSRLLAIELMNEPHVQANGIPVGQHEIPLMEEVEGVRANNVPFAQHIVRMARGYQGTVPLTIGCISLWHNLYFGDDLDVYQYHDNFPGSAAFLGNEMKDAWFVQQMTGKPCWLTEWQRVRSKGPGWDIAAIPEEDKTPALHTIAPIVYGSGMGSFFWSLMVHPAYLMAQRPNGTYNGLFHEDGSVYSLEDYQAIAGRDKVRPVKAAMPDWYVQSLKEFDE